MHEGNRLEYLLKKSGKSMITIAENAKISRASLYNYFEMEYIPRPKLLSILDAAGIPKEEFYIHGVSEPETEYQRLQGKIKSLEQMLKDKEVIIINQQEIIDLLKQSKSKK